MERPANAGLSYFLNSSSTHMNPPQTQKILPGIVRLAALSAILFSAGCASVPKMKTPEIPVFYPSDPASARLQYLTSFAKPEDIEPGPSPLLVYAMGPPPPKITASKPYGVTIRNGTIYLCDTVSGVIHILDLKKHEWSYFQPSGRGALRKPINIRVDDDGTRYIADTLRGEIVIFGSDGKYLGAIPGVRPSDVALTRDRIYVADLQTSHVRVYEKEKRAFLFAIPREGEEDKPPLFADATLQKKETPPAAAKSENVSAEVSPENDAAPNARLGAPVNIALGPDGALYVSDLGNFCVKQFDADGKLLRIIGRSGDAPGMFARNKGIAVDRQKMLYVIDAAFENGQIFSDDGKVLLYFGDRASGEEGCMILPAGMCIDYDNVEFFRPCVAPGFELEYVVLVANQYGGNKINVYGRIRKSGVQP
jgi:hypothetical protein